MQDSGAEATQDAQISRAVAVLEAGGVVGYPSETVWGLAALPQSRPAVDRLYLLKGREAGKPVQLSCAGTEEVQTWLRADQSDAPRLFRFWPGPLTLVAWARPGCPPWLAPGGAVGVRIPASPAIRALLRAVGGTLATTSLNPSGQPPASTPAQAQAYGLADLLLSEADAGAPMSGAPATTGLASTVFDLRTRRVLRPGALTEGELLQALS